MTRPTNEDREALGLLLSVDILDEKSALFCESLYEDDLDFWAPKQCKWFDELCERYL